MTTTCFHTVSLAGMNVISPCDEKISTSLLLLSCVLIIRLFPQFKNISDEETPLLQNQNTEPTIFDRKRRIINALAVVLFWIHFGETLVILIRYLPQNKNIPEWDKSRPHIFHFTAFILLTLVWILHFILIQYRNRFLFYFVSFIGYCFECSCLVIYLCYPNDSPFSTDYTLNTEFLFGSFIRLIINGIILILFLYMKYGTEENSQPLISDFNPPSSFGEFMLHFKSLSPFFWPKNRKLLQLMMVGCLISIILGRYVNIMVPLQYKKLVDELSIVITTFQINGKLDYSVLKQLPYGDIFLFVIYRLLAGGGGLFSAFQTALWVPIGQYTTKRVSLHMFEHLHSLSLRFHLNRKTGEILRVQDRGVSSIVSLLSSVLFNIIPVLADIAVACVYFTIQFDLYFGFIVFSTMVAYIWITIWVTEWRTKYRRNANALENAMEAKAVDSLLNFETVKYFGAEKFESGQYEMAIDKYQNADLLSVATMWILDTLQNIIINGGMFIGCILCAKRILLDDVMSVGDFVLYMSYLTQLYAPLTNFGNYYKSIQKNFVDMEKLLELFKEPPEVCDSDDAQPLILSSAQIEFRDVTFGYDIRKQILKGVSFVVPPGQSVALVGDSGSGKSTILKLLFRFYDVSGGAILLGGKDIRKVTQASLRSVIGVVPQDTVLFNADIKYNIRYGRPTATDSEIKEAAEAAQIHERILSFPDGYKTKVGERGLRLSGGEKQRVAIARTILKNPPILVLGTIFLNVDEATSALDTNTESALQRVLSIQGRTSLVVAHRLSTIKDSNLILVMKDGLIIERGTHQQLMDAQREYYSLWMKQLENSSLN